MNKEINIITLGDIFKNIETDKKAFEFLNYIKKIQNKNIKYKEVIDKIKEYGENCLENLKDQDDFINESVNVVALLKMIHQNYLELLEEIE